MPMISGPTPAVVRGPVRPQPAAARPRAAAKPAATVRVATEGVREHWLSRLPSPVRFVALTGLTALGRARRWVSETLGRQSAPADAADPKGRAAATWKLIEARYGIPGMKGHFTEVEGGFQPATVWPHGQAIAAALDLALLTGDYAPVDASMKALSLYMDDGAYGPFSTTGHAHRLWDDNAWIGLDFMQAYAQTGNRDYLAKAEAIFPFMESGLHREGGLYWEENNQRMTRNTCANAPSAQYALRLYQATKDPKYLRFAENLLGFMNDKLRSPEGLYYDHLGDDGKLDKTIWSYNQGAAIGANLLKHRASGDPKALELARETANAALAHFGRDDRLWKQPPSFNAIFFRNLLALDAVAPDPRYRQVMTDYLERVWQEGRDPATGALNQGGIGKYDPSGLLDQAAIAQMNALLAWPKDKLPMVG
ncbi:MAG: glycoside hydrolase family 76 protein [Candidatus Sericytochromatia bacterium]